MIRRRLELSIVWVLLISASFLAHAGSPIMAAASSLRTLWPELVQQYTQDTGELAPKVSFGSSGLLSTQIINGAPFELFLSADQASIDRLPARARSAPSVVFAYGDLHIVVPQNSAFAAKLTLDSIGPALSAPDSRFRLAIPNPVHAPYGIAAKEALNNAGLWPLSDGQLLVAENAAQSLQFVRSGAVEAAFVPKSLLIAHGEDVISQEIDPATYAPVQHTMVILPGASESAKAFYSWLLDEDAQRILQQSGLQTPQ